METFGKFFKRRREFRGVRKEVFCTAIGIDKTTLDAVEAGEQAPPQDEPTFIAWLEASTIPTDKPIKRILWELAQDF